MTKKINKISITIILLIIIMLIPNISKAETNNGTDEKHMYTIEDLIYNKIPLLDVNVFKTGDVTENSSVMTIRKTIAIWYVSLRNLTLVILAILIIYTGVRLAISTVASDKAKYKQMIYGWLIAITIVFFIHYIIYFIIQINETLVKTFSRYGQPETTIYETIATRAKDLRFSVGIPATIIYVVLFIYFLKFLWIYLKRYFTIMILLMVAPLIGAKYAIDSAKRKKKGSIVTKWLNEFTLNVLMQSVHALTYTALMSIAINLSTTTFSGYIFALIFINFIIKADKIVMNIFNFGKSKMAGQNAEHMQDPKKQFGEFVIAYESTKNFLGMGKDIGVYTGKKLVKLGKNTYNKVTDKIDESEMKKLATNGGGSNTQNEQHFIKTRDKVSNFGNHILDGIEETANKGYKKITKKDSVLLSLAVMSRKKGSTGKVAKKQLKKETAHIKKSFTAPFKFVKDVGGNVLKIGFGIPGAVVNPTLGIYTTLEGIKGLYTLANQKDKKGKKYKGTEGIKQKATLGLYGTVKEETKTGKKLNKTVKYLNEATMQEDAIEDEFKRTFGTKSQQQMEKYKKNVELVTVFGDEENLAMLTNSTLAKNGITKIDEFNIQGSANLAIDSISQQLDLEKQYGKTQARKIKNAMRVEINNRFINAKNEATSNGQTQFDFGNAEFGKAFSDAIKDQGIDHRYDALTKKIGDLHKLNIKAEDDIKIEIVKESKFIRGLKKE